MAGDSTPKANLHADHSESDDAQRFEISKRAHTTAVRTESEAGAAIADGPAVVDAGRARGPRHLLHKKKRGAEDDIPIDSDVMPQDIDEDVEQPNEAVEQIEWPQQVIYWKSITVMNQALHRENENKFKDMIAVDRVKISALSVKVAKLSTQNRRLREELSEERSRTLSVYKDKSPIGLVFDSLMEPQTCTETCTQREDTGREIMPVVDVPSAGHDTEMQTCIDTLREDIGMEIKQSEDAPPPAPDTSTDDEDAPIRFSRALNKRKRGARGAREKVAAAAPLKRKRCKRTVKPSKWVVTPYTEGKKKKEKDNIGDKAIIEVAGKEEEQMQEKIAELAPARLQSDPHSI
ncbi:uncharacterized protein A4U43_C01F24060 [Asparagus officinalis]|uniref:Uncharacterized protein n=1 Tax=Asparagus officinalis TaxID=4686 RepID=A0A5P1FTJ0_ASPOF|nr:uncharacterized protein A4U43_C01F24060 [Asparagus officinalis]